MDLLPARSSANTSANDARIVEQRALDTWYESITYDFLREQARKPLEHVERSIEKAERRTHAEPHAHSEADFAADHLP